MFHLASFDVGAESAASGALFGAFGSCCCSTTGGISLAVASFASSAVVVDLPSSAHSTSLERAGRTFYELHQLRRRLTL